MKSTFTGEEVIRTLSTGSSVSCALDVEDITYASYADTLLFYTRNNYIYMRVESDNLILINSTNTSNNLPLANNKKLLYNKTYNNERNYNEKS